MTEFRTREVAVLTTVYPAVLGFLSQLGDTLRSQTDQGFTTVVVCEGVPRSAVQTHLHGLSLHCVEGPGGCASNRVAGLSALLDAGVEKVVLVDADDTQSSNRVAMSRRALESDEIVFNDLSVDGRLRLSRRLSHRQIIGPQDILGGNALGLTNTSARLDALRDSLEVVGRVGDVVDWPLFTDALLRGRRARFLADVVSSYAPGGLGVMDQLTPSLLGAAVTVKAGLYQLFASRSKSHAELAPLFARLRARLVDGRAPEDYLHRCRDERHESPFWWEAALPIAEYCR